MSRTPPSLGLFTDFYELTMAQAYWHSGQTGPSTFSLFFRHYPPDRGYYLFAGLAAVLDYLEGFGFSPADLDYLRSLGRFDPKFVEHLGRLRFTGSARALPEGTVCFANEPVIEVTGPLIEAQLVETYLINQVNLQTILATKASRVVHAARGRPVVDFGARRAHGVEAANRLARVSYLAGFESTSNTLAGALYGIPVSGTMAHSYITSFESEVDSFRHFAASFPDTSTFLVDSYDTLAGARKAVTVAREMRARGHELRAVRLDSGDLLELSRKVRAILDEAGLAEVRIVASGGLDEFGVDELLRAGAPVDGFGVGTKIGVSADAPWTDCVYKLVEYAGRPVLKLSSQKQTLPGAKQVFRYRDAAGLWRRDVIARADEGPEGGQPLLHDVLTGGKRVKPDPALEERRDHVRRQLALLPEPHRRLRSPVEYEVGVSEPLSRLRREVAQETRAREIGR